MQRVLQIIPVSQDPLFNGFRRPGPPTKLLLTGFTQIELKFPAESLVHVFCLYESGVMYIVHVDECERDLRCWIQHCKCKSIGEFQDRVHNIKQNNRRHTLWDPARTQVEWKRVQQLLYSLRDGIETFPWWPVRAALEQNGKPGKWAWSDFVAVHGGYHTASFDKGESSVSLDIVDKLKIE